MDNFRNYNIVNDYNYVMNYINSIEIIFMLIPIVIHVLIKMGKSKIYYYYYIFILEIYEK